MPKIFLLEDGEIEEDIKWLIKETAKTNKIRNLKVVLTKVSLSLNNLPMNCDAYILNLGLVDESYLAKIKTRNPHAKIYGTGVIRKGLTKFLNDNHPTLNYVEVSSILKDINLQDKKVRR